MINFMLAYNIFLRMDDNEKNQSGTQIGSPGGPKVGAIGPFFAFFLKK